MVLSKEQVDIINATPSKRIYRSIIADYDLNTAVSELIDNAIDAWSGMPGGQALVIAIEIDLGQQKITIMDNAGGVKENELKKLISPGETTVEGTGESIGIFGVGSKRAVVALSQAVRITTRYHQEQTYRLEYDDDWLQNENWDIPYYRVDQISPSTTKIELPELRFKIDEEMIEKLREQLSVTYAYFLDTTSRITIKVDDVPIVGKYFENWAYPQEANPKGFIKKLVTRKGNQKIRFEITSGLVREKGALADYGVYFYCNKRLICKALRTPEVGFSSRVAGIPHHTMCLARIFVKLDGPSDGMPWTSNKAGINYNHDIFQAIRKDIIEAVKAYTQLSKKLHPVFNEKVFPYDTGQIEPVRLENDESIKPSKLPPIPRDTRKKDFKTIVLELNKNLSEEKPWIQGLYESIIAERLIADQRDLRQRNRISVILLDSTIEIAFKEFLVYEVKESYSDKRLIELTRLVLHDEVKRHLPLSTSIWNQINFLYKMRCELIHRKATAVSGVDIDRYRKITMTILNETFGIQFPDDSEI